MRLFFLYSLLGLLAIGGLSACTEAEKSVEKKVERPIEYDKFGNEVLYTADGEKEYIDEDCD